MNISKKEIIKELVKSDFFYYHAYNQADKIEIIINNYLIKTYNFICPYLDGSNRLIQNLLYLKDYISNEDYNELIEMLVYVYLDLYSYIIGKLISIKTRDKNSLNNINGILELSIIKNQNLDIEILNILINNAFMIKNKASDLYVDKTLIRRLFN